MKTNILKIYSPENTEAIQEAACLLDEGALVAFPTETVYGIGCKVDLKTIERLNILKGRSADKHYTLHIGNYQQLAYYVPVMNVRTRKLVNHVLPGPVTIVFEFDENALNRIRGILSDQVFNILYSDGTLGVRYPKHPVACSILSRAKFPIVAPSANISGHSPAITAGQVASYFDGKIECIVDVPCGDTAFNKSSTVVKIGKRNIQILRQGVVKSEQIREISTLRILFVCTGNTCRSPMAEGICRKYFADFLGCSVDELNRFGYIISSVGIFALEGTPASRTAVEVCGEHGIDLNDHRSQLLTVDAIEQSDLIYVMSRSHRDSVVRLLPSAEEKCFILDENSDIQDPAGLDRDAYEKCFVQIQNAIMGRIKEFL